MGVQVSEDLSYILDTLTLVKEAGQRLVEWTFLQ